ncbi:hypothetical protein EJB05_46205, partial [Eragrostis curvula]
MRPVAHWDGWEKSWEVGVTPWDLGKPTPVIEHLVRSGTLPKGRALVPGCGMGYDVVALASPERYVVGLDILILQLRRLRRCFTLPVVIIFAQRRLFYLYSRGFLQMDTK